MAPATASSVEAEVEVGLDSPLLLPSPGAFSFFILARSAAVVPLPPQHLAQHGQLARRRMTICAKKTRMKPRMIAMCSTMDASAMASELDEVSVLPSS